MDYERPLEHVAILVGPDETISSYDGHDVTFTAWTSRLDNVPDRVLVFVHGARERAWIYGPVADRLAGVFSSTYAMDLRGHALADLSEAQRRGRLEGVRALVEDLAALLTHVRKQHPDATIVLGGQSIGATIALAYVKRANALVGRDARGPVPRIDALLLTSPALQLNLRGSLAALRSSGGLAALLNFGSEFPAGSLEDFTSGSRWYNTFRQTEALSALTWSYVWTLVQLVSFWRLRYPRHVLEPTLIIAGTNDQLIDSAGALRLRAALNHACSPSLVLVEGAYHTVFHDETSSQTDAAISDWVEGIDSVRASQPPTQGDYCVYRSDRWIRAVNSMRLEFIPLFAGYLMLFFALKIVAAALAGTLASPELVRDYATDSSAASMSWLYHILAGIVPPWLVAAVEQWGQRGYYGTPEFTRSSAIAVPLLRDYIDLAVTGLFAARMALLHGHWDRLSALPRRLWDNGVVDERSYPPATHALVLGRYDRKANSRGGKLVAFAIASAVLASMYGWLIAVEPGIYPSLSPSSVAQDVAAWQAAMFDGWWANPYHHPLAFAVHVAIALFVVYYTMRSNQVGAGLIKLLEEVIGRPEGFRPRPDHPDGLAGLRPVRELLVYVFLVLGLLGVVLVLMLFFLPYRLGWTILLPGVLIAIAVSPVIILKTLRGFEITLLRYRTKLTEEHARHSEALLDDIEQLDCPADAPAFSDLQLRLDHVKLERRRIEAMPTELFSRNGTLLGFGSYVLPLLALVVEFMR